MEGEEEEGREDGEDLWVRGGPSQGMDYGSVDPTVASSSSLGARGGCLPGPETKGRSRKSGGRSSHQLTTGFKEEWKLPGRRARDMGWAGDLHDLFVL